MNARLIEKIVKYMIISFLLVYVGVQATRFLSEPIRTQTAHLATVFQSVSGPAVVFRDEIALEGGAGVVGSLFDDAVRVVVGEPVAEFLPPGTYVGNRTLLRQTQSEIDMLEQAQGTLAGHISNTEILGRSIQQQVGLLVQMSATGGFDGADSLRSDLTSLLNQRQIATGNEQCFSPRIARLTAQRDRLAGDAQRNATGVVNAPRSGFYARSVDGLENTLTLEAARGANLEQLRGLIENSSGRQQNRAGRIVTSHNWYVAVLVSQYETQWTRVGQRVEIIFQSTGMRVPATVRRVVANHWEDTAVLVLHSNQVDARTINLRADDVRVDFSRHEGIRVESSALRFVDGERGVFTLSNNVVSFRRVDPIFEEPGFLLSAPPADPRDATTLRKYDQIIIRGVDLEHGRVLG